MERTFRPSRVIVRRHHPVRGWQGCVGIDVGPHRVQLEGGKGVREQQADRGLVRNRCAWHKQHRDEPNQRTLWTPHLDLGAAVETSSLQPHKGWPRNARILMLPLTCRCNQHIACSEQRCRSAAPESLSNGRRLMPTSFRTHTGVHHSLE